MSTMKVTPSEAVDTKLLSVFSATTPAGWMKFSRAYESRRTSTAATTGQRGKDVLDGVQAKRRRDFSRRYWMPVTVPG